MQNNTRLKNISKLIALVLIGVVLPLVILVKFSLGFLAIIPLTTMVVNAVTISYVAYICREEFF